MGNVGKHGDFHGWDWEFFYAKILQLVNKNRFFVDCFLNKIFQHLSKSSEKKYMCLTRILGQGRHQSMTVRKMKNRFLHDFQNFTKSKRVNCFNVFFSNLKKKSCFDYIKFFTFKFSIVFEFCWVEVVHVLDKITHFFEIVQRSDALFGCRVSLLLIEQVRHTWRGHRPKISSQRERHQTRHKKNFSQKLKIRGISAAGVEDLVALSKTNEQLNQKNRSRYESFSWMNPRKDVPRRIWQLKLFSSSIGYMYLSAGCKSL